MSTKSNYTITIDEGTTSTRALMISSTGEIIKTVQKEITQYYPQPGWVEHDATEIWEKTLACLREVTKACLEEGLMKAEEISGIAITNQRETTVLWNAKTGEPIHKAIVWQCRRTSEICDQLKKDSIKDEFGNEHSFNDYVSSKTGLIIDAYFSGTKIKWILERCHSERSAKREVKNPVDQSKECIGSLANAQDDGLIFGTIDTWLIWNLTLGRSHFTDASNASRTMLYDIHENKWDTNILKHLNIPNSLIPEVINSNGDFGSTPLLKDMLDREIPIKAVLGDQQAALYAYDNQAKATYGTGTFVMLPSTVIKNETSTDGLDCHVTSSLAMTSNERDSMSFATEKSNNGLVKTNAYKTQSETALAIEGSIFVGGSIIQWLRDGLKIIKESSDVETLAREVEDNGGVYLIPALAGLGAPHWNQDVRGAIFGLTRGSSDAHIARAALEAMAYSVMNIFETLDPELRQNIKELNVDGGATKNNLLMQLQADLLGIPVKRYTETEMTALGVAKMTGDVELELKAERIFKPENNLDQEYKTWKKYLNKLLD